MRKTKIVCTLGPASNEETIIEQLILAGMDAARFNFSHGTHETHLAQLTRFKHVRDSLGRPVATILLSSLQKRWRVPKSGYLLPMRISIKNSSPAVIFLSTTV